MCGILGTAFISNPINKEKLNIALENLLHRGPDGAGFYRDSHVTLGHTRLSILDLSSAARQPMTSEDGRYIITYNGEIYNFLEVRTELAKYSEIFLSHSDTEVILIAYKRWGKNCVHKFRGMFAFAIWDKIDSTLFLARDRCGEKPLFFYRNNNGFYFASELKALLPLLDSTPSLDPKIVDLYLHYQFTPEPYTLLEGIQKLPAAHTLMLTYDNWRTAEPKRYWDIENINTMIDIPSDEASISQLIRDKFEESVRLTLRADVPIGIGLSGGIDSSAIATFAQKNYSEPMHAFCIGYPGRPIYDERMQAKAYADSLHMVIHEIEISTQEFVNFFPKLVRILDEPIADPAVFGHYAIPKIARQHGIKVLLTGIGGDELFWGYPWVKQAAAINQYSMQHPKLTRFSNQIANTKLNKLLKKFHSYSLPKSMKQKIQTIFELQDLSTPPELLSFYSRSPDFIHAFHYKKEFCGSAILNLHADNPFSPCNIGQRNYDAIPNAIIKILYDTWLTSNCLSLGDRVSMSVGVENRLPFLDVNLIELVMAIRTKYPDHTRSPKEMLRNALKNDLPHEILSRPKAGFQPPVKAWLSNTIEHYGSILEKGELVKQGIIQSQAIPKGIENIYQLNHHNLFFIYKLLLLEMWYQEIVLTQSTKGFDDAISHLYSHTSS